MTKRCASDFKDYEDVCVALEHTLRYGDWDMKVSWHSRGGFHVSMTRGGTWIDRGAIVTHDHDWANAVVAAILRADEANETAEEKEWL